MQRCIETGRGRQISGLTEGKFRFGAVCEKGAHRGRTSLITSIAGIFPLSRGPDGSNNDSGAAVPGISLANAFHDRFKRIELKWLLLRMERIVELFVSRD